MTDATKEQEPKIGPSLDRWTPWWKVFTRKVVRFEFDDRAIGADRRAYREKHGISLRTFAKEIGFSGPYVSDLELGRRAWSEQLIYKFEAALERCIQKKRMETPRNAAKHNSI